MSIHEMFLDCDLRALDLVPDYKVNLIAPAMMDDKDFDKFHSPLKDILLFIKHSKDKKKFKKLLETNKSYHHIGKEEIDVINECTGANIKIKVGEEEIDMCEAIQQMIDEAVQEAKEETQKAKEETKKERFSTLSLTSKVLWKKWGGL